MSSISKYELDKRLHALELMPSVLCKGPDWHVIHLNQCMADLICLPAGDQDVGPLLDLLDMAGFDEVDMPDRDANEGEGVVYQRLGSVFAVRWQRILESPDNLRAVSLFPIPMERINRGPALPWHELNVLLDSIHDGIWVIDANGTTLRINKALERIAGLSAEDVIGKHVTEPMHHGRFETCVTLRALTEKRVVTMFDDYANGKRCLNTSTPIFDDKGRVWRVIASIRDMTEFEELKHKLTELEIEAEAYKARLQNLESDEDSRFVGHSAQLRRLRQDMAKAARTGVITLIQGETGTGKTLAAKAIHDQSARRNNPFVAVNCGAIPSTLVESELFGYEKGAFTGASKGGKLGMFEMADKGTILLDEIGELPLSMQVRLLQVLDGHPFLRVGGTKPIHVDIRVIAATNRKLEDMVGAGQFREDLFYRLRVLSLTLPPLRERVDDIPILAMHFLRDICEQNDLRKCFDPTVLNCLLTYSWPGNVRELKAIVHSLATMSESQRILTSDLPEYMQPHTGVPMPVPTTGTSLRAAIAETEKRLIMAALTETGSTYKAAKRLKVSQSTIVRKAQRYNLGMATVEN